MANPNTLFAVRKATITRMAKAARDIADGSGLSDKKVEEAIAELQLSPTVGQVAAKFWQNDKGQLTYCGKPFEYSLPTQGGEPSHGMQYLVNWLNEQLREL